jgi:excisionase family DNA binding protein
LTLDEAAAYLRVAQDEVIRLVQQQGLPGRLLGAEWRFLKSALADWLRTPPVRGSKEAVLSVAGAWKDDPYIEKELEEIYKQRGRPMTENGG